MGLADLVNGSTRLIQYPLEKGKEGNFFIKFFLDFFHV